MTPSHASTPHRRGRWRVRHLALTALGATALLTVALSGVGGSYALWQDSATVDAGTLTTGTAELAARWASGHSDAAWSNLLPGEWAQQEFTLDNTGSASLELTVAASTGSEGFEVRASAGECGGTPLSSDPANGARLPLMSPSGTGAVVLAGGTVLTGCLEVRAAATSTPAQEAEFTVQFDGQQVAP